MSGLAICGVGRKNRTHSPRSGTRARARIAMPHDHEKLDVCQVSLDFKVWGYELCNEHKGADRHARDQWLRASPSITPIIAEGCGKIPTADRGRFLQIASGAARECSALVDILNRCGVIDPEVAAEGTKNLCRSVSMLTRMIERGRRVWEERIVYGNEYAYEGSSNQRTDAAER